MKNKKNAKNSRKTKQPRLWMPMKDNEAEYSVDMLTGEIMVHRTSRFARHCKSGKVVHVTRPVNSVIKGTKAARGYMQALVNPSGLAGNAKFRYVHDLVAELAWELPVPQEYLTKHTRKVQVVHLDGNKLNNAWWNLGWRVLLDGIGSEEFGRDYWYPERKMRREFAKLLAEAEESEKKQ